MIEDYQAVEKLVPIDVDRSSAEEAIMAGEVEGAIASLVEEAFEAGRLTFAVLDLARSLNLGGGPGELIDVIQSKMAS